MPGRSGPRNGFFGREATRRKYPDRRRDDQRRVGTSQCLAKCFDDLPIDLTVSLEFREVVIERRMDHAIGGGRAAAQAVEIFQIAAMHLSARSEKRLGAGVGTRKSKHLMARRDQFLNDGSADKSGRASNKDTHESSLHV